jgi:hypothetical protein
MTKTWITQEQVTDNNVQTLRTSGARVRQYHSEHRVNTMIDTDTVEQEQLLKILIHKAYLLRSDYNI